MAGIGNGKFLCKQQLHLLGVCAGACTSHSHISGMKLCGAEGFMTPNCTRISRVWKSRNELFEIIKERRELLYLLHSPQTQLPVLTAAPSTGHALGALQCWEAQSVPKFQLLQKLLSHPLFLLQNFLSKCSVLSNINDNGWMFDRCVTVFFPGHRHSLGKDSQLRSCPWCQPHSWDP